MRPKGAASENSSGSFHLEAARSSVGSFVQLVTRPIDSIAKVPKRMPAPTPSQLPVLMPVASRTTTDATSTGTALGNPSRRSIPFETSEWHPRATSTPIQMPTMIVRLESLSSEDQAYAPTLLNGIVVGMV